MIARFWQGVVAAKEAGYRDFLDWGVVGENRSTSGNQAVTVMRREERECVRFLIISYRDSLDAIRACAGDDLELARYRPGALGFPLDPVPSARAARARRPRRPPDLRQLPEPLQQQLPQQAPALLGHPQVQQGQSQQQASVVRSMVVIVESLK